MAKLINKVDRTVTLDDKTEIKIYVQRPNNNLVKLADRHKSKAWNQAIQDDVLTKKELAVLMDKRGIWDETKDKQEDEITHRIVKLEQELYNGDGKSKPKVSEGRDIAIEIRKARMGTATPAQDKVKRLQAAQRKGADTGPSQKDLDKAKAEKKKIKQQNTASQNQKNKVKKIAEEGKKAGKSKSAIRAAIKKAVPNAAKLMVTVGGRAVPIVGWGLLAYDAARAAKYIKENPEKTKKYSLGADTIGYKRGGKVRTMRKGGKVSHYKHGQSIKRGLIKDTPSGQDLVNSIYDTI